MEARLPQQMTQYVPRAHEGLTPYPAPAPLAHGAVKSGLAGQETSETFFKITVPDGASRLRVSTSGGAGDLDLLVRNGKIPECPSRGGFLAPCEYDDASLGTGNNEMVQV